MAEDDRKARKWQCHSAAASKEKEETVENAENQFENWRKK
jgi:hypothetical protein